MDVLQLQDQSESSIEKVRTANATLCTLYNINVDITSLLHRCPSGNSPSAQIQFLSRNSFASLIFVARYGLPPRSGWLSSISCLWFFRTLSLVRVRSLESKGTFVSKIWESLCIYTYASYRRVFQMWCCALRTYESWRMRDASRRFIRGSNPPL